MLHINALSGAQYGIAVVSTLASTGVAALPTGGQDHVSDAARNTAARQAEVELAQALKDREDAELLLVARIKALDDARLRVEAIKAGADDLQGQDAAIERARVSVANNPPVPKPAKHKVEIPADERYRYSPICRIFGGTPELLTYVHARERNARNVDNPLNRFTVDCLALDKRSDYDVVDLNGQLQANSTTTTVEVVPSYTRHFRTAIGDNRIRSSYYRFRLGASIPLDKGGKSATFADLSKPNFADEVGVIAGFEYGRVRVPTLEVLQTARKNLEAARHDCIDDKTTMLLSAKLRSGDLSSLQSKDLSAALEDCDGRGLSGWMAARGSQYYKTIVKPIWQPRADPTLYVGVEGRYARATRSFFPLRDPAQTGVPLLTQLPADFPATPNKTTRSLYALKLYGGSGFLLFSKDEDPSLGKAAKPKEAALGASIAYRRDLLFPAGTADRTICPPTTGAFVACPSINIAPPYLLDGWVAGLRGAVKIPRIFYLPEMGIEAKLTYALDIKQFGVELPLYIFADPEGKTQGGVALNCTGEGRTDRGFVIEKDCRASVFIGRRFNLAGKP